MKPQDRTRAILRSSLPSSQRLVLIAVADYADQHGECWPSQTTLAMNTGYSRRTIGKALAALIEAGILSIIGQRSQCHVMRLDANKIPKGSEGGSHRMRSRFATPAKEVRTHAPPAKEVRNPCERGSQPPANEVRTEATKEATKEATSSLSGKPDEVSPARQVWLHWKKYHPRARKLREADARKIRGRLAEDDLETCLLVADWVHLAPDAAYFRGENDQQTVYTGCATLFKADKWSQRVERAQRWHEQGRPDTSTPSKPRQVPPPVTSMGRWEEERRLKREAYEREQAELMERIRETAKHDPEYAKMMGLA